MRHMIAAAAFLAVTALLAEPSAAQVKTADPPDPAQPPPALSPDSFPGLQPSGFVGRSGATKERLLKVHGGSKESELAVERGLAWLAKQQKPDGGWVYDGSDKDQTAAAAGMGVLPFLGAGHTHKQGKYQKTVKGGIDWLVRNLKADGQFLGAKNMYAQAIGTLALAECYGLTKDRALLRPTQLAVNYIQKGQAADGSWGYQAGNTGDTSILGWQIQALKAAQLAGDIVVDAKVLKKAVAFLDKVGGEKKATYGYTMAPGAPGTTLTAVGLWCRTAVDDWKPNAEPLIEGADGMFKRPTPKGRPLSETYFYYYATLLVRSVGGEVWDKWNAGAEVNGKRSGGVRDVLINSQVTKDGPNQGSWDPDQGFIGKSCGRLGTTAMSVLMLEVYYRYLPPPKK